MLGAPQPVEQSVHLWRRPGEDTYSPLWCSPLLGQRAQNVMGLNGHKENPHWVLKNLPEAENIHGLGRPPSLASIVKSLLQFLGATEVKPGCSGEGQVKRSAGCPLPPCRHMPLLWAHWWEIPTVLAKILDLFLGVFAGSCGSH